MSRRRVAREVFGDERLRGRVDRILRDGESADPHTMIEHALERLVEEDAGAQQGDEAVPALEELVPLYARTLKRRLADPNERVTASELHTFARLELWVENKRRLVQLRELTREPQQAS
jgi:hypothetical protein